MIIDKTALEQALEHLIEQARQGMEGVGLLAEDTRRPIRHVRIGTSSGLWTNVAAVAWAPLRNVAEFRRLRYEVDPPELLEAYQRLEDMHRAPVILVHSHLTGGGLPSETDIRYATNPALLHMIVDLGGIRPVPYLWRITPHQPVPFQRGEVPPPAEVHDDVVQKVHFQVVDLLERENPATDLTRGVAGA